MDTPTYPSLPRTREPSAPGHQQTESRTIGSSLLLWLLLWLLLSLSPTHLSGCAATHELEGDGEGAAEPTATQARTSEQAVAKPLKARDRGSGLFFS